jgi:acetylornithine/succinyldiaminopimelate/putrescine aminotransferase
MTEVISAVSGFVEAERDGAYISDINGQKFIDCYTSAGTFNLGRRNEQLIVSLKKAIHVTDQGNFLMISEQKALLAARISEFVPGPLECVLYGVLRGESMDAACKLARGATGRPGLVTVDGGYYGDTGFALSLSEHPLKSDFGELIPGIIVVPFGDYQAAEKVINHNSAAFIIELVQVENHCRTAETDYIKKIRSLCDKTGTCLIFDESQTGFGRTGRKFAFEHYGVYPDILITGEAMTGGIFPMTAVVFTKKLKQFFDLHPLIHLSTFAGHDVGCMVAAAAMDEYEKIRPWGNAIDKGTKILNELSPLSGPDNHIKSLTGLGLLISIGFESSQSANRFCLLTKNNGILLCNGIVDDSCCLLRPSLLITEDETEFIIRGIKASIKQL